MQRRMSSVRIGSLGWGGRRAFCLLVRQSNGIIQSKRRMLCVTKWGGLRDLRVFSEVRERGQEDGRERELARELEDFYTVVWI